MGYDIPNKMVRGLMVRDSSGYEVTLIRPRFRGFFKRIFQRLHRQKLRTFTEYWFPARCNFVIVLLQFVFV